MTKQSVSGSNSIKSEHAIQNKMQEEHEDE